MDLAVTLSSPAVAVVAVSGVVDVFSVARLRDQLVALVGRRTHVVVDCAGVTAIDATGLGVFVGALLRARRAGVRFGLTRPTREIEALLAETRLDRVLPVVDQRAGTFGAAVEFAVR